MTLTSKTEKAFLEAEEIDKATLLKLTNNKELVLVHWTTVAPWDLRSSQRVPCFHYYADKDGKIFKFRPSPEPIKYNHGNRYTVENEAEALVLNIKNFFKNIALNDSESEIVRGLLKTRHPQQKLLSLLLKKKRTEVEAQSEFNFILLNSILESLDDISTKHNISAIELISEALNIPQMQNDKENDKFKNSLEAIKLELELTTEKAQEQE